MAKLSAHGQEVGTIYGLTGAKRYMSDGKILKNSGFGWKLWRKCKPEVSPAEAYQRATERQESFFRERPHYAAYRKALHDLAGLCKRWKLHSAIQMMPDDCDGVWSEACDGYGDNIHADLNEIAELCQLYRIAEKEAAELRVAA